MAKTREDLLISPRYLISSQNCWWAVCFKAGINIVATEESIFMCWHQEHGLLGSEETRQRLEQGYSLQTTTTTANLGPPSHTAPSRWNTTLSHFHRPIFLRNSFSFLQSLAINDFHEYLESTNADRRMPLWRYMSLTRELTERKGNTILWS